MYNFCAYIFPIRKSSFLDYEFWLLFLSWSDSFNYKFDQYKGGGLKKRIRNPVRQWWNSWTFSLGASWVAVKKLSSCYFLGRLGLINYKCAWSLVFLISSSAFYCRVSSFSPLAIMAMHVFVLSAPPLCALCPGIWFAACSSFSFWPSEGIRLLSWFSRSRTKAMHDRNPNRVIKIQVLGIRRGQI